MLSKVRIRNLRAKTSASESSLISTSDPPKSRHSQPNDSLGRYTVAVSNLKRPGMDLTTAFSFLNAIAEPPVVRDAQGNVTRYAAVMDFNAPLKTSGPSRKSETDQSDSESCVEKIRQRAVSVNRKKCPKFTAFLIGENRGKQRNRRGLSDVTTKSKESGGAVVSTARTGDRSGLGRSVTRSEKILHLNGKPNEVYRCNLLGKFEKADKQTISLSLPQTDDKMAPSRKTLPGVIFLAADGKQSKHSPNVVSVPDRAECDRPLSRQPFLNKNKAPSKASNQSPTPTEESITGPELRRQDSSPTAQDRARTASHKSGTFPLSNTAPKSEPKSAPGTESLGAGSPQNLKDTAHETNLRSSEQKVEDIATEQPEKGYSFRKTKDWLLAQLRSSISPSFAEHVFFGSHEAPIGLKGVQRSSSNLENSASGKQTTEIIQKSWSPKYFEFYKELMQLFLRVLNSRRRTSNQGDERTPETQKDAKSRTSIREAQRRKAKPQAKSKDEKCFEKCALEKCEKDANPKLQAKYSKPFQRSCQNPSTVADFGKQFRNKRTSPQKHQDQTSCNPNVDADKKNLTKLQPGKAERTNSPPMGDKKERNSQNSKCGTTFEKESKQSSGARNGEKTAKKTIIIMRKRANVLRQAQNQPIFCSAVKNNVSCKQNRRIKYGILDTQENANTEKNSSEEDESRENRINDISDFRFSEITSQRLSRRKMVSPQISAIASKIKQKLKPEVLEDTKRKSLRDLSPKHKISEAKLAPFILQPLNVESRTCSDVFKVDSLVGKKVDDRPNATNLVREVSEMAAQQKFKVPVRNINSSPSLTACTLEKSNAAINYNLNSPPNQSARGAEDSGGPRSESGVFIKIMGSPDSCDSTPVLSSAAKTGDSTPVLSSAAITGDSTTVLPSPAKTSDSTTVLPSPAKASDSTTVLPSQAKASDSTSDSSSTTGTLQYKTSHDDLHTAASVPNAVTASSTINQSDGTAQPERTLEDNSGARKITQQLQAIPESEKLSADSNEDDEENTLSNSACTGSFTSVADSVGTGCRNLPTGAVSERDEDICRCSGTSPFCSVDNRVNFPNEVGQGQSGTDQAISSLQETADRHNQLCVGVQLEGYETLDTPKDTRSTTVAFSGVVKQTYNWPDTNSYSSYNDGKEVCVDVSKCLKTDDGFAVNLGCINVDRSKGHQTQAMDSQDSGEEVDKRVTKIPSPTAVKDLQCGLLDNMPQNNACRKMQQESANGSDDANEIETVSPALIAAAVNSRVQEMLKCREVAAEMKGQGTDSCDPKTGLLQEATQQLFWEPNYHQQHRSSCTHKKQHVPEMPRCLTTDSACKQRSQFPGTKQAVSREQRECADLEQAPSGEPREEYPVCKSPAATLISDTDNISDPSWNRAHKVNELNGNTRKTAESPPPKHPGTNADFLNGKIPENKNGDLDHLVRQCNERSLSRQRREKSPRLYRERDKHFDNNNVAENEVVNKVNISQTLHKLQQSQNVQQPGRGFQLACGKEDTRCNDSHISQKNMGHQRLNLRRDDMAKEADEDKTLLASYLPGQSSQLPNLDEINQPGITSSPSLRRSGSDLSDMSGTSPPLVSDNLDRPSRSPKSLHLNETFHVLANIDGGNDEVTVPRKNIKYSIRDYKERLVHQTQNSFINSLTRMEKHKQKKYNSTRGPAWKPGNEELGHIQRSKVSDIQDAPLDLSVRKKNSAVDEEVTDVSHVLSGESLVNKQVKAGSFQNGTSLFLPMQDSPLNLSKKSGAGFDLYKAVESNINGSNHDIIFHNSSSTSLDVSSTKVDGAATSLYQDPQIFETPFPRNNYYYKFDEDFRIGTSIFGASQPRYNFLLQNGYDTGDVKPGLNGVKVCGEDTHGLGQDSLVRDALPDSRYCNQTDLPPRASGPCFASSQPSDYKGLLHLLTPEAVSLPHSGFSKTPQHQIGTGDTLTANSSKRYRTEAHTFQPLEDLNSTDPAVPNLCVNFTGAKASHTKNFFPCQAGRLPRAQPTPVAREQRFDAAPHLAPDELANKEFMASALGGKLQASGGPRDKQVMKLLCGPSIAADALRHEQRNDNYVIHNAARASRAIHNPESDIHVVYNAAEGSQAIQHTGSGRWVYINNSGPGHSNPSMPHLEMAKLEEHLAIDEADILQYLQADVRGSRQEDVELFPLSNIPAVDVLSDLADDMLDHYLWMSQCFEPVAAETRSDMEGAELSLETELYQALERASSHEGASSGFACGEPNEDSNTVSQYASRAMRSTGEEDGSMSLSDLKCSNSGGIFSEEMSSLGDIHGHPLPSTTTASLSSDSDLADPVSSTDSYHSCISNLGT